MSHQDEAKLQNRIVKVSYSVFMWELDDLAMPPPQKNPPNKSIYQHLLGSLIKSKKTNLKKNKLQFVVHGCGFVTDYFLACSFLNVRLSYYNCKMS